MGEVAGTPECTLRVPGPGYSYTGFTFVNLKDPINLARGPISSPASP